MTGRREQAARWFAARRRGVMTLEERAAYETWARDPENRAAMAEMDLLWGGLEAVRHHLSPVAAANSAPDDRRMRLARSARVAVLFGAVLLGVGMLTPPGSSDWWTALDWWSR